MSDEAFEKWKSQHKLSSSIIWGMYAEDGWKARDQLAQQEQQALKDSVKFLEDRERRINEQLKHDKENCNYCTVCMTDQNLPGSIEELLGEESPREERRGR